MDQSENSDSMIEEVNISLHLTEGYEELRFSFNEINLHELWDEIHTPSSDDDDSIRCKRKNEQLFPNDMLNKELPWNIDNMAMFIGKSTADLLLELQKRDKDIELEKEKLNGDMTSPILDKSSINKLEPLPQTEKPVSKGKKGRKKTVTKAEILKRVFLSRCLREKSKNYPARNFN